MWIKKFKEKNARKFYFAAKDMDDLEEWTIYLDFAKAKAQYEDFSLHFGKIQFPLIRSDMDDETSNFRLFKLNYKSQKKPEDV